MASAALRTSMASGGPPLSTVTEFKFERIVVRVTEIEGAPWFVANDVCMALQIGNPSMALRKLDPDEKGVREIDTLGGKQDMLTVSESGLYVLILRSHGAVTPGSVAYRFRKWVTAEVLPSIRKNGFYAMQGISAANDAAHRGRPLGLSVDLPEKTRQVWTYLEPRLSAESWTPIALSDVATGSGVRYSSVSTVVNTLVDRKLLWRRKGPHQKAPNEYRLRVEGSTRDAPKTAAAPPAGLVGLREGYAVVQGQLIDMTPPSYRKGEQVAVRLLNGALALHTLLEDAPIHHFVRYHRLGWVGFVGLGIGHDGHMTTEHAMIIGRVVGPALPPPADAG